MNLVTSLQRSYSEWLLHKEPPKWLTGFVNQRLPGLVALLLVVLIAQQAAEMTWRFIPAPPDRQLPEPIETPVTALVGGGQTADSIARRIAAQHLFGVAGEVKPVASEQVDTKAPETRLNLTLHGVFAEQKPEDGAAIIGTSGSKQNYYRVGSQVMQGVKLQAVFNDRVVLLRNGESEILKFPKTAGLQGEAGSSPKSLSKASSDNPESLGSYRDMFKNEPLKIFEYVRFIPVRSGNTVKGYRVLPQRDRKLYNQLGIRPSDLVTAVNGVPLQDDKQAMQLIDQLKDADQLQLDILRRGQPESLTISLN